MAPRGSTLGEVSRRVGGRVVGDAEIWLSDVTHDSRLAGPGSLFVAVRGASHDGHAFIDDAVAAGSPAVAVESPQEVAVGQVVVEDTREAMGPMAAQVHGDPSTGLAVVGVTGTNGKTTVTHYVESLLVSAGHLAGLIGTVETRVGTTVIPTSRTTPEATDFQRLLAEMGKLGADVVAAEVSSHALEMSRVAATRFAVAAFTNLSQDHLDFHGTMAAYRRAKERLFREYEVGTAVLNVDDPMGAELARWVVKAPLIRVGADGEVRAEGLVTTRSGSSFDLVTDRGTYPVTSGPLGAFNVENALVAVGCCLALGVGLDQIGPGLDTLRTVPGRLERVSGDGPVSVIVDYAHTPGGIEQVISVARSIGARRVIAVVGAGGDRDRAKRPMMGRAASAADVTILTSDNPRSEDPDEILHELTGGAGPDVVLEVDRHRAIERAIDAAEEGDVVLILGKGHETGQEVRGDVLPFDDRAVAREILVARGGSTVSGPGSGSMSQ